MKHKHHIIPRYMGGSDSRDNLVELTITQHAMFHYCNYQLWNNEEDRIAWKALSGQITIDEAKKQSMILGARKGLKIAVEASKAPEARKKQKESFKRISHQSGEKNSMYGTMWITDGTKKGSFRIKKGESIPEGYIKGRVV